MSVSFSSSLSITAVPKIAFSFWEGSQFTYLHYLTLVTFRKHNPDFKIIIYTTHNKNPELVKWSSGEQSLIYKNLYDFQNITNIDNLDIIYIDVEKELNCPHTLSSVWKSDIVRILKLYEHGGIYIDFDTLFIKPVPDQLLNIKQDMAFNTYDKIINNAFIVAKPCTQTCKIILDSIIAVIRSGRIRPIYMQFGPALITKSLKKAGAENNVYYIPNDMTCPYLYNQIDKLFNSNEDLISGNTFCIHWYNGDPISREYCSRFDINNISADNNIFERELVKSLGLE